MMRVVLVTAVALALSACTVGPAFVRPTVETPSTWIKDTATSSGSQPVAAAVDTSWWSAFGDPVLTRLAERVARDNLDWQIALARLAESRVTQGITAADAFPQLNANASATREKPSAKGVVSLIGGSGGSDATQANGLGGRQGGTPVADLGSSALTEPFNLFQTGFDASWELDLWGRVRRAIESARATAVASEETSRDTLISMIAELARDYLQLRGTQDRMRITAENLGAARELAVLTRQRLAGGLATDLDVANADAEVNALESEALPLEQEQASEINAIGFLLGLQPGAMHDELTQPSSVLELPVRVPVGLPSELAQRRPDIRRAEANLHAATADIGVAQANFYPQVTLSGSVALQALQLKNLGDWDARTYGFGPSVSLPIFDGARLKRTLELRKVQQREAAVTYRRTVLNAWREVDDALAAFDVEQRRRDRLAAQLSHAELAFRLAQERYERGIANFLDVLTAQRTVIAVRSNLASSTTTINTNLVALYKALGGGWEGILPVARNSIEQNANAESPAR
jgi:NodT family efflux transporter outer membrane factor (OMF) lipoprotein